MSVENRKAYLELGFCDAIHRSKAWCSLLAGHDGKHKARGEVKNGPDTTLIWGCNESIEG